jgi:hypothetical protein
MMMSGPGLLTIAFAQADVGLDPGQFIAATHYTGDETFARCTILLDHAVAWQRILLWLFGWQKEVGQRCVIYIALLIEVVES